MRVGADRDDRPLVALGRLAQPLGEGLGGAEDRGRAVDRVLAAGIHRHVQDLRLLVGLARAGRGQVDLQLRVAAVRRREEEEDQDDDEDVDQGNQVQLQVLPLAAAAEVHARRSPWITSISLIAWLSISITRLSPRLRKWR